MSRAVSGTRNARRCWKLHAVGIYTSPPTPTARQITHWAFFFGPWHLHSILHEGSPWPRAGNTALWHSDNSGQSDTGPASRGLWCRKMYYVSKDCSILGDAHFTEQGLWNELPSTALLPLPGRMLPCALGPWACGKPPASASQVMELDRRHQDHTWLTGVTSLKGHWETPGLNVAQTSHNHQVKG